MSRYGKEVTQKLTDDLVVAGFTPVSGLSWGVDVAAYRQPENPEGKHLQSSVAVLTLLPRQAMLICTAICRWPRGAIISEMPLGLRPNISLFPACYHITSGLSLVVVVTEGADDSGALIAARYAAEQGRGKFAVPGPIRSIVSLGPVRLIKNGAKLVEDVHDIVDEFKLSETTTQHRTVDEANLGSEYERKIVDYIRNWPVY